jgi:type IV pilus assembly protein PilF
MRNALVALALVMSAGCVTVNSTGGTIEKAKPAPRAEPDLREAARVNTDLGVTYARDGNYDVALDKFTRAIGQDANYAPAHSGIAFVYAQRHDNEKAEAHYERALQLQSDDPMTRNNYGAFLCSIKRYKEAEKLMLQAAKSTTYREPERAYANLGACAQRIPDLNKAEGYYREALARRPDLPDALQQMASILLEKRDYARARVFLQRYEKVGDATAATLWMGARIEYALGDKGAAAAYQRRLRIEFPDSEESLSTLSPSAS